MAAGPTIYGDITPRTAAFAVKQLLKRAIPYLCIERYGQATPLPAGKTDVVKFRRFNAITPLSTAPLTEGVSPTANQLSVTDYTCTMQQYGDLIQVSDQILDFSEDPILQQSMEILGEEAAQVIETVRYNVLTGGTSVFYANGAARAAVNTPITLNLQRAATRALKAQNARKLTKIIKSTPDYGTEQVNASFVGLVHSDCEADIRNIVGFTPVEKYGTLSPWENEIGKVEDVRYVYSSLFASFQNAGGAAGGNFVSQGGTDADVYPILILGADAYGIVPFKGLHSVTPMIVNAKPSAADPLAQRGYASWKAYQATAILNQLWMTRLEVAASMV